MRYYPAVRPAIPHRRAGCSRVTHPFATNREEQALRGSFDLHVLGTPPAFVLSQDQTLRRKFYKALTNDFFCRPNHESEFVPHNDRPTGHCYRRDRTLDSDPHVNSIVKDHIRDRKPPVSVSTEL